MLALGTTESLNDRPIIVLPFGSHLCDMAIKTLYDDRGRDRGGKGTMV